MHKRREQFSPRRFESLESRTMLAGDLIGSYAARASLVVDLNLERVPSPVVADVEFNGHTYFVRNSELWKTDHTPEGTQKVANVPGFASKLHVGTDRIYYAIDTDPHNPFLDFYEGNIEIWSTDGSPDGTTREDVVSVWSANVVTHVGVLMEVVDEAVFVAIQAQEDSDFGSFSLLGSNVSGEFQIDRSDEVDLLQRSGDSVYVETTDRSDLFNCCPDMGLVRIDAQTGERHTVWWQQAGPDSERQFFEELPTFQVQPATSRDWSAETLDNLLGIETASAKIEGLTSTNVGFLFQLIEEPRRFERTYSVHFLDETNEGPNRLTGLQGFKVVEKSDRGYVVLRENGTSQRFENRDNHIVVLTTRGRPGLLTTDGTNEGTSSIPLASGAMILVPMLAAGSDEFYQGVFSERIYREVDGEFVELGRLSAVGQVLRDNVLVFWNEQQESLEVDLADGTTKSRSAEQNLGDWRCHSVALTPSSFVCSHQLEHELPQIFIKDIRAVFDGQIDLSDADVSRIIEDEDAEELHLFRPDSPRELDFLAQIDGRFVYHIRDQLWSSDGTPESIELLKGFERLGPWNPDDEFYDPPEFVFAGGRVFFTAYTPTFGQEIWSSDGTLAGTELAIDLLPGPQGSWPTQFVTEGDQILFHADDGTHGRELWRIDLSQTTETVVGDANQDGSVNFADFLILSANYGSETDAAFAEGDFDGDGVVSFTDFLLLSENFESQA